MWVHIHRRYDMQVKRLLPVVALTLIAAGCENMQGKSDTASSEDPQARADIAAIKSEIAELKDWLGRSPNQVKKASFNVHQWHQKVYAAICNLENRVKPGGNDVLCHPEISADHNAPPNPPPWL
jgi:hypothetical protein